MTQEVLCRKTNMLFPLAKSSLCKAHDGEAVAEVGSQSLVAAFNSSCSSGLKQGAQKVIWREEKTLLSRAKKYSKWLPNVPERQ